MNQRIVLVIAGLTSVAILAGCASRPHAPQVKAPPAAPIVEQPFEDQIYDQSPEGIASAQRMLGMPAPDVSLHGDSFESAIVRLRDGHKVNIFVNWKALESVGVRKDLPITIEWSGLTLGQALNQLTNEMSVPRALIGYCVDEGVITISLVDDLARTTVTRVYNIRGSLRADHRDEDVASIIRSVKGIQPLTWKANGGTVGAIHDFGTGELIVTQTLDVHRRITVELAGLKPLSTASANR